MSRTLLFSIIFVAGVFLDSVTQLMLKKSALKTYPNRIREYLNPLVLTAYFLSTANTFVVTRTYSELPLSMGPILEASGYLFVTFWGVTVFKEKLGKKKIIALLLIIAGILVYYMAKQM